MPQVVIGTFHDSGKGIVVNLVYNLAFTYTHVSYGIVIGGFLGFFRLPRLRSSLLGLHVREHLVPVCELIARAAREGYGEAVRLVRIQIRVLDVHG